MQAVKQAVTHVGKTAKKKDGEEERGGWGGEVSPAGPYLFVAKGMDAKIRLKAHATAWYRLS